MELFYNKNINDKTFEFSLDGIENNHINKVLRKKEGDILTFTNGKNLKFTAEIIQLSKKISSFKVLNCETVSFKNHLHIAISILKSPSRFENFIEKAVEIGVSEITPLICERSQKSKIKIDRNNKIIISALKQSFKFYLPKLNKPINFVDFIKSNKDQNKLIATCKESKKALLADSFHKLKSNVLLIGPEGDFTETELNEAQNYGFKFVTLGDTRLRAETAGIVSCAIFSTIK